MSAPIVIEHTHRKAISQNISRRFMLAMLFTNARNVHSLSRKS